MANQMNLHREKISYNDVLIIKYDGPSFNNNMELHAFTRQIYSIEKMLMQAVDNMYENRKILDTSTDTKFFIELRKGSFETALSVVFCNPICVNLISNLIYEYLKYLVTGVKSIQYEKEIQSLVEDKSIRKYTKSIINPCITNSDNVTIINGDVTNQYVIDSGMRIKIEEKLSEVEKETPIESFEQDLIGRILKIDAVKSKDHLSHSKLGFVIEGQTQSVEASFESEISEDDMKKILFSRIKIKAIALYKSGDLIKVLIKSYEFSPKKKLSDYI